MNRNLILILLLASFGFNAFFVAGYLRANADLKKIETPQGRVQLMMDRLNLNAEQEKVLIRLEEERIGALRPLKIQHAAHYDAFWTEIQQDDADPRTFDVLLTDSAQRREKMMRIRVKYLAKVMQALSKEQRARFVQILQGTKRSHEGAR